MGAGSLGKGRIGRRGDHSWSAFAMPCQTFRPSTNPTEMVSAPVPRGLGDGLAELVGADGGVEPVHEVVAGVVVVGELGLTHGGLS